MSKNKGVGLLALLLAANLYSETHIDHTTTHKSIAVEDFFDDDFEIPASEFVYRTCLDPFDIVNALTNPALGVELQTFLSKLNLYKYTNPIMTRDIHTLPALRPERIDPCGHNHFGIKLFYNQMRKAYLTYCSPYIESYLSFNDPDFIAEINRLEEALGGLLPPELSIPEVFPLFAQIKLEERRLGGMFYFQRRTKNFEWRLQAPLYYIEHNFFLTEKEREAISNAPLFQLFSAASSKTCNNDGEVEEFLKQHLVNDLFGIGDLRFQGMWDIVTSDWLIVTLGLELQFPSDFIFANGLIGGPVNYCPAQPPFNFYDFICVASDNPYLAQQIGTDLGVYALNRLTNIATHTRLGDEHFGIGLLAESIAKLDDCWSWENRFRLLQFIPGEESRFMRATKNPADFIRDYTDPNLATQNLNFLSEQFVLFIYPPAVIARVFPGVMIEYSTSLYFDKEWFKWEIGYDYWYQAQEKLSVADHLQAPPNLDCSIAVKNAADQNKFFTQLMFEHSDSCYDWHFALFGDITVSSKGIGKDWTAGFDIGTLF